MIEILAKVATGSEYTCGGIDNFVFSGMFPYVVSTVVMLIKIIVPILLIIFGMLDLAKAVIASKEDEIKKAQMTFVKRLIAAVIVFFVVSLVQIVVRFVSGNDENSIMGCFNCFVNGSVSDNNSSPCQLRN